MHIERLKNQQKSSFYIAQFENVIAEWRELKMAGLNIIPFYKTGHLATNIKYLRTFKVRY